MHLPALYLTNKITTSEGTKDLHQNFRHELNSKLTSHFFFAKYTFVSKSTSIETFSYLIQTHFLYTNIAHMSLEVLDLDFVKQTRLS